VDEREVVRGFPFVTDKQGAKSVVPAVRPLDDPTSRLATNAPNERLFTSTADVRDHAPIPNLALGVLIVEALVEAEVVWSPRPTGPAEDHGIERRAGHPFVVDVRRGHLHPDRDASSVGQNVAFRAEFCTIGRIGARVVPPFGAFTLALSSEHHLRSTPTRSS
jgi:hypothetical protein